MKKGLIAYFLLILFTGITTDASAQFWKKIFKKEQKRPVRKKTKAKIETPVVKPKKKRSIDYPKSELKQHYRIDLLASLYLNELIKDNKPAFKGRMPEKAVSALDFYEGLKLAADTLSHLGYHIDLFVHDVTDSTKTPEKLIATHVLDSSDLIIGAVPSKYIAPIAKFAKAHNVNFASVLLPYDAGMKDNPWFIIMQPTLQTHCEWLGGYLERERGVGRAGSGKAPVLLYRNTVPSDMNNIALMNIDTNAVRRFRLNKLNDPSQIKKLFDSTAVNTLIMPILDEKFCENMLQKLGDWFPRYKFEVYGMPSWKSISTLRKADAWPNIAVYFTAPFYFDATTASGQAVVNAYKRSTGNERPSEMVYRGYESLYWFAYLLGKYGTIFNEKLSDNGFAPFTRFDIKPVWTKDDNLLYLENRHIVLYRYSAGNVNVIQ
jgi:hypothetical protein